jgi:hypothetical protein
MKLITRMFFFTVVLGLLTAGLLSAKSKSYDLTIGSPTKVGSIVLKSGDYRFKVEGTNVVFTRTLNDATSTVPVKVETGKSKSPKTSVTQTTDGGQTRIVSIEPKGTTDILKFD